MQDEEEAAKWERKADRVMDEAGAAFARLHTALNEVQALMNEADTQERVARVVAEAQTSSLPRNMDVTEATIYKIRETFDLWRSSMANGATIEVDHSVVDTQ